MLCAPSKACYSDQVRNPMTATLLVVSCSLTATFARAEETNGRAEILDLVTTEQVRLLRLEDDGYHVAGEGSKPFALSVHKKMVAELAGDNARCTDILVSAQWQQDVLHQTLNAAHFDNCAFEEGMDYVQAQIREAHDQGRRYEGEASGREAALEKGLQAIGRALHAVQDFYSHSNYLELQDQNLARNTKLQDVPLPSFWSDAGRAEINQLLKKKRLHSGTWPLPLKASKKCAKQTSHGELAKDNADTKNGKRKVEHHSSWGMNLHEAAAALALRASVSLVSTEMPAPFKTACGKSVGMLLFVEGRPAQ